LVEYIPTGGKISKKSGRNALLKVLMKIFWRNITLTPTDGYAVVLRFFKIDSLYANI